MWKAFLAAVVASIGGCAIGNGVSEDLLVAQLSGVVGFALTLGAGTFLAFRATKQKIRGKLKKPDYAVATDFEGLAIDGTNQQIFVGTPGRGKTLSFDQVRSIGVKGGYDLYVATNDPHAPGARLHLGSYVAMPAYKKLRAALGDRLTELRSDENDALAVVADASAGSLSPAEARGGAFDAILDELRDTTIDTVGGSILVLVGILPLLAGLAGVLVAFISLFSVLSGGASFADALVFFAYGGFFLLLGALVIAAGRRKITGKVHTIRVPWPAIAVGVAGAGLVAFLARLERGRVTGTRLLIELGVVLIVVLLVWLWEFRRTK